MINRKILRTLILALAILSVANAAALAGSSRNLQLDTPATLNGVQLAAGQYKVSWEAHSLEVTVTVTKGKNVIVTAQGKLADRDANYNPGDAVTYRTNPDGSRTITELQFRNMKQVIVFGE